MIGYIYRITNKVTHQNYIGQTIDIRRRRNTHFSTLRHNCHDNPKLQASWNKYGENNFEFESWEFKIASSEELNRLECEYIDKFNGLTEGFNLVPGGGVLPIHQKVKDDDIVTFLCVYDKLGDGYGKTCEQIFGWAKGTASKAKRGLGYSKGQTLFSEMTPAEREERADNFIQSQHLKEVALERQLTQGGCLKAYQLTSEDFYFAFAAQQMGYSYSSVAEYLGVKSTTVKDWFNGRSRKREREQFDKLDENGKSLLFGRVKTAGLSGKPKSVSSN